MDKNVWIREDNKISRFTQRIKQTEPPTVNLVNKNTHIKTERKHANEKKTSTLINEFFWDVHVGCACLVFKYFRLPRRVSRLEILFDFARDSLVMWWHDLVNNRAMRAWERRQVQYTKKLLCSISNTPALRFQNTLCNHYLLWGCEMQWP